MAFDKSTRNRLASFVGKARDLIADEFTQQFQSLYGISDKGTITPLDQLGHLDDPGLATAALLRERIDYLVKTHPDDREGIKAAVARLAREQAFTVLNRLAAIRMAEKRGLIVESVGKGYQSKGFKVFEQVAGSGLGDTYHRYCRYIFCLFDELAVDLGVLFDRRSPHGLLFPRETALLALFDLLNAADLDPLWAEDETIGWVYQYFNSKIERDAMRKASRSPRDTRELAVRNQFFTPRYVVEFLTDNTLGRIWFEMTKGATRLANHCRYLVHRPNEIFLKPGETAPVVPEQEGLSKEELLKRPVHIPHRPIKDPRELRMLDPACGSMHFGLYAFDLYEVIYEEAWDMGIESLRRDFPDKEVFLSEVPRLIIEHNIHGIDIDPRAAQIAGLSLWLRAQKSWQTQHVPAGQRPCILRSNIVCAEPMPGEKEMLREFTATLDVPALGYLVEQVFDKMQLAGEAGSLLKIEKDIREIIEEAKRRCKEEPTMKQLGLFSEMPKRPEQAEISVDEQFWEGAEEKVYQALKEYAEVAGGHVYQRRLFAEDAARGFAFIDICRWRYDVVLMNPPFGASSIESKEYIEDQYPNTKGDVLANFIERVLDLAHKDGRIGAISSRTPFFLGSFESFRNKVLGKSCQVRLLADLGEGVLEAMVETAVYVLTKATSNKEASIFFRLLVDEDKGDNLLQLTSDCCKGVVSDKTFIINPTNFEILKGKPYAYWVNRKTLGSLGAHPSIEGNLCSIRVGLQTGEDFRHLRLLWEIPTDKLVPRLPIEDRSSLSVRQLCIDQLRNVGLWIPFSKTDLASPWFSPITLAVNWARDGKELKNFTDTKGKLRSRPQNEDFYFRPGFSYMLRSTRLVPYLVPAGVMPTAGRAQIFPEQGKEYAVLGICASNVGSAVARFSGEMFARPKFQAGMVQGLPSCNFTKDTLDLIKEHVDAEVNARRAVVQRYEPFQEFTLPAWCQPHDDGVTAWDLYSLFGRNLERKIAEAFGLDSEQLSELERDIREAVSIRGPANADVSDDVDEESTDDEQELNIELISESPEEKAIGLCMYGVGVVFGRWDVRIAQDPSLAPKLPDPFDPLPVCPPGMLVGTDGLPAEPNRLVSKEWLRARPDAITLPPEGSVARPTVPDADYPLRISWPGVLVDDENHPEDIVARVEDAFKLILNDRWEAIEHEACKLLGVKTLRDYFGRPSGFFADHLKRYSKSRRQAPIYWPLSTAKGSYTLWIYYHRLTDQTLHTALADFVDPKLKSVRAEISTLRESGTHRDRLEELLDLEKELADFHTEIERIIKLPWKPNLNDGVLITASPLWKLFRLPKWQKDLKACWEKLEKGDYDWVHLAYSIWPKRVEDVCKKDRSIAIAHGLEHLCQVEPPKTKGTRGRKKAVQAELDELSE